MENLSIFDIFKIGVGPSSSHTLGPWKAARNFVSKINFEIKELKVELYGSLSKTGIGHGTDIAILMGLQNFNPETVDTSTIFEIVDKIKFVKQIEINQQQVNFNYDADIIFKNESLPYHPNALKFIAKTENKTVEKIYYSTGGGFIVEDENLQKNKSQKKATVQKQFENGKELFNECAEKNLTISELILQNDIKKNNEKTVESNIIKIWKTMQQCIYKGCFTEGILPGGLNVKRRAKDLNKKMLQDLETENFEDWIDAVRRTGKNFLNINKWISCFAIAVNEENANFGRVVTSPTNGAAGVIPAVLMYYVAFDKYKGKKDIVTFISTAAAIGMLFKKGATISAAQGGCQAEIGVSSSMAAAGLCAVCGGTNQQILMAAEIAMEHHLGLTCDPIKGLVQIPCIERNTMGAAKAITASNLALMGKPEEAKVNFDEVVKTMWQTAQDMNTKYKETAEGGLAISVGLANC